MDTGRKTEALAKLDQSIKKIKQQIKQISDNHYDRNGNVLDNNKLVEVLDPFIESLTDFMLSNAGDLDVKKVFTQHERSLVGNFYVNMGVIRFDTVRLALEEATTVTRMREIQKSWTDENGHKQCIGIYYKGGAVWYPDENGKDRAAKENAVGSIAAIENEFDILTFTIFINKVNVLKAKPNLTPAEGEFLGYLVTSIKAILNRCNPANLDLNKSGVYVGSTWLMLVADLPFYLPEAMSELMQKLKNHKDAFFATIDHESRRNDKNFHGFNVATLSARSGNVEFARAVLATLEDPADRKKFMDAVNPDGKYKGSSAFMFACQHGHTEYVKLLLANKVNYLAKKARDSKSDLGWDGFCFAVAQLTRYPESPQNNPMRKNYIAIISDILLQVWNEHRDEYEKYLGERFDLMKRSYMEVIQSEFEKTKDQYKDESRKTIDGMLSYIAVRIDKKIAEETEEAGFLNHAKSKLRRVPSEPIHKSHNGSSEGSPSGHKKQRLSLQMTTPTSAEGFHSYSLSPTLSPVPPTPAASSSSISTANQEPFTEGKYPYSPEISEIHNGTETVAEQGMIKACVQIIANNLVAFVFRPQDAKHHIQLVSEKILQKIESLPSALHLSLEPIVQAINFSINERVVDLEFLRELANQALGVFNLAPISSSSNHLSIQAPIEGVAAAAAVSTAPTLRSPVTLFNQTQGPIKPLPKPGGSSSSDATMMDASNTPASGVTGLNKMGSQLFLPSSNGVSFELYRPATTGAGSLQPNTQAAPPATLTPNIGNR